MKEGFTCCATEHSIFTHMNDLGMAILAEHIVDMPVVKNGFSDPTKEQ